MVEVAKTKMIAVAAVAVLALAAGTTATAGTKSASAQTHAAWYWTWAKGSVTCADGDAVTGIWIGAGRGSNWAIWPTENSDLEFPATAHYFLGLPTWENYTVTVGCGGTPSSWAEVDYSSWMVPDISHSLVCGRGSCWPTLEVPHIDEDPAWFGE